MYSRKDNPFFIKPHGHSSFTGLEDINYTPDMRQSIALSLTPVQKDGGAVASGLEVEIISPEKIGGGSICDNISEIVAKTDRAKDLYRFTDEVSHV